MVHRVLCLMCFKMLFIEFHSNKNSKGAFTLVNFVRDFALSLHVLLNKNYLFSLLNVQASAKSRAKLHQCKRTLSFVQTNFYPENSKLKIKFSTIFVTYFLDLPWDVFSLSEHNASKCSSVELYGGYKNDIPEDILQNEALQSPVVIQS